MKVKKIEEGHLNMILKIKKFFNNLRIFKRVKVLTASVANLVESNGLLRDENYRLKGQMITKRKLIKEQGDNIIKTVLDLENCGSKKKKGEILIAQLIGRRDELLHRIGSKIIDPSIGTFADYKFWVAEPFIKDTYSHYKPDKDQIDGVSAIRGLGSVIKKIDEKPKEKTEQKVDNFTIP